MIVKSLTLRDFRNYKNLSIEFSPGTTVLYGDNAQGKTNILEALYLCGTTRSHRGSKDHEMIRFGKDEAHIKVLVEKDEREKQLDMHLRRDKSKGVAIDRVSVRKASEYIGNLNLIMFSPEDLSIVKRGPAYRRHFMDMELAQIDRMYIRELAQYNKSLMNRNKVLRDLYSKPGDSKMLDVWDDVLVKSGKYIIRSRRQFVKKLGEVVPEIYKNLSGNKEEIEIEYEPGALEEKFEEQLFMNRDRDLRSGYTSAGPHHDDIKVTVLGNDLRKYGSQGQQRTAALSLKMSELRIMKEETGENPVLLLDDVMSELDGHRQQYLLSSLKGIQTVMTCTGMDELIKNDFHIDKVYFIKEGTANGRK